MKLFKTCWGALNGNAPPERSRLVSWVRAVLQLRNASLSMLLGEIVPDRSRALSWGNAWSEEIVFPFK